MSAIVQTMKDAQTFLSGSFWEDFVIGPIDQLASATTDEAKAKLARDSSVTMNHPVGTARMSPFDADWGVVNPNLLVKGFANLRVVDASIFVRSSNDRENEQRRC